MDDTPRSDRPAGPTEPVRKRMGTGMMWAALAVVIAFGAGFLWQFYEASTTRGDLEVAEQELAMERLRVSLGQAALAANTGNYESARQQMSTFYGQLQELSPAMTPQIRRVAEDFLTMRDDVITGLSRSNPEYSAVLYGMLETLNTAIDESFSAGAGPGAAGETPADTTGPPAGNGATGETGG